MRFRWCILAALTAFVAACRTTPPQGAPSTPPLAFVVTQVPVTALHGMDSTFPRNMAPPLGSRIVRVTPGSPEGPVPLVPDFAATADPCISFSADSLLFAGKRTAGEPWDIWRMPIVGGAEPQRVTRGLGDCREPFFMALSAITPPEFDDKVRWIGFTSTAAGTYDERGLAPAGALYCQSLDSVQGRGIVTWRTTFNLSHDFSPTMLADGRVLFTSWRFEEDTGQEGIAGLLASDWSGTGGNLFFGTDGGMFVKSMACELPESRTVVFVESDGRTPLNGGSLARVHMARPLATYERISDVPGSFLTPHALPGGGMVVAYASDGLNYGIYRYDAEAKRLGLPLFDDPAWADTDPQAIAARPEPQGQITIVVDSRDAGDVQCMNVYDSDRPRMRGVLKGSVKRVRIIEGLPRRDEATSLDTINAQPRVRVIGEAPVESDGSFYVRLPADTPIRFQLLGDDGLSLMNMGTWTWLRRGDMRGCIGCHEDRELAPENRATLALLRARADTLMPPPARRTTVDFRTDIAPILALSCARCHTAENRSGLNLSDGGPEGVYARLLTRRSAGGVALVRPGYARESGLAAHVLGSGVSPGGGSKPGAGDHCPAHRILTGEQIQTICTWIDLGAQFENSPPNRRLTNDGGGR